MICDEMNPDEIYHAFQLYAVLHGIASDEDSVKKRVDTYLKNNPDEIIDEAIVLYLEDRVYAPPNVVVDRWGMSRLYTLDPLPNGGYRHQVCDDWFQADCQLGDYIDLAHFWTTATANRALTTHLKRGDRCHFSYEASDNIQLHHRQLGEIGVLNVTLSEQLLGHADRDFRYLPFVDSIHAAEDTAVVTLLVVIASAKNRIDRIVPYADIAFHLPRHRC